MYAKLFFSDATKRHFVPRQSGYEGPVPAGLDTLTLTHPMIAFRKHHLGRYLTRIVTAPCDAAMVDYLDTAGKLHRPRAGSPALDVPLVQMNAQMGFVATAVTQTILSFGLDRRTESRLLVAFGKVLWIQNDIITRHYQPVTGRMHRGGRLPVGPEA